MGSADHAEPEAPAEPEVPKTPKGSKKAAEPVVVVALADQAAAGELAALQAEIDALEA